MTMKRPDPIFEVLFEGVYPEKIPLGMLARTLAAIQRLAVGADQPTDVEDDEELRDDASIRLLDVRRGSAIFRFVGQSPATAIAYLREAGKLIKRPDEVGEHDYLLRPIERLSATAKTLGCEIIVREP